MYKQQHKEGKVLYKKQIRAETPAEPQVFRIAVASYGKQQFNWNFS